MFHAIRCRGSGIRSVDRDEKTDDRSDQELSQGESNRKLNFHSRLELLERGSSMVKTRQILTARDIMTRSLITLSPDVNIFDAMSVLMAKGISGAPVLDGSGKWIGMLSELDCLRVLSSHEFYADEQEEGGQVRDFMTESHLKIGPDLGIYAIAHYFLTNSVRRLPVVSGERLLGQVSRRDVLRGIELMRRRRSRPRTDDYLSVARSWSAL